MGVPRKKQKKKVKGGEVERLGLTVGCIVGKCYEVLFFFSDFLEILGDPIRNYNFSAEI
jgi:hypothetical protein